MHLPSFHHFIYDIYLSWHQFLGKFVLAIHSHIAQSNGRCKFAHAGFKAALKAGLMCTVSPCCQQMAKLRQLKLLAHGRLVVLVVVLVVVLFSSIGWPSDGSVSSGCVTQMSVLRITKLRDISVQESPSVHLTDIRWIRPE